MKWLWSVIFCSACAVGVQAQAIPNLPIPLGAGSAEVWSDQIYYFGGSNNWAGSTVYPRIYRYNGSAWSLHDSIPDGNLWDVETVLVNNQVYLISGWPSGPRLLRKYDMVSGNWTYLSDSPNTQQTWGVASEHLDGKIYLFLSDGNGYRYTITTDTWDTTAANNTTATWDLSSILYQDEIYIIGYNDTTFFKYTPATDLWTQLSNSPYQVGACAMGIVNNLIYCVGGNSDGASLADYNTTIVYDITADSWATDSLQLSAARHWMATAEYFGGLYVLGGIDAFSQAVDTVEQIVPQGTAMGLGDNTEIPVEFQLHGNFPNPFNPVTNIRYDLARAAHIELSVYNIRGEEVASLQSGIQRAGQHQLRFNASHLASGIYFYRLMSGRQSQVRRMVLIK